MHSFWPFFKQKIGSDLLTHCKIRKQINVFTRKSPGLRLPWDFWSAVHVIKQSRMRLINRLIKWNEQIILDHLDCNLRLDCGEMEWKISFSIEEYTDSDYIVKRNTTPKKGCQIPYPKFLQSFRELALSYTVTNLVLVYWVCCQFVKECLGLN